MSHNYNYHPDDSPKTDADTITYVRGDDDLPSYSVVMAVAAVTGAEPDDLRPLCDAIDPDALNRLIEPVSHRATHSSNVRVGFEFNGCGVTVYGDGRTVVSIPEGDGP